MKPSKRIDDFRRQLFVQIFLPCLEVVYLVMKENAKKAGSFRGGKSVKIKQDSCQITNLDLLVQD